MSSNSSESSPPPSRTLSVLRVARVVVPLLIFGFPFYLLTLPKVRDRPSTFLLLLVLFALLAAIPIAVFTKMMRALKEEGLTDRVQRARSSLAQSARQMAEHHESVRSGNTFGGVVLDDEGLRHQGNRYPWTSSVRAEVESSGQILQRFTVTRFALLGPAGLALPKRKDRRSVYLTVEGDEFAFVVKLEGGQETVARSFAARINQRAKGSGQPPAQTRVTSPVESALLELQKLRDSGLVSEDEYNSKRSDILGRL